MHTGKAAKNPNAPHAIKHRGVWHGKTGCREVRRVPFSGLLKKRAGGEISPISLLQLGFNLLNIRIVCLCRGHIIPFRTGELEQLILGCLAAVADLLNCGAQVCIRAFRYDILIKGQFAFHTRKRVVYHCFFLHDIPPNSETTSVFVLCSARFAQTFQSTLLFEDHWPSAHSLTSSGTLFHARRSGDAGSAVPLD